MKLKSDFVLREIADEFIVVPICEEADRIHGIINLSESGAFLWNLLQNEQTEDSLVAALLGEYEVDEATARADVNKFIASITEIGCLAE